MCRSIILRSNGECKRAQAWHGNLIDKTDSLAANQIMFIFMNSAKHFWQISLEKY